MGYAPDKKMPSHVTIREILQNIDYKALTKAFHAWMVDFSPDEAELVISLDGKALRNTVSDPFSSEQNFIQLVHAFVQEKKIAIRLSSFEQKKNHEGQAVRELIEQLNLKGVIFTLDALHAQKKL